MDNSPKEEVLLECHGIKGKIVNHQVWGVAANALIISLPEAREVLSSREGFKKIRVICNCYLPQPIWQSFHARHDYWKSYLKEVLGEAKLSSKEATALSTGVNMEDVAWREEVFEELWVLAVVTAGVKSNAMRVGKDEGSYIEQDGLFNKMGTINTILLTGASLDLSTLAASFITITEAKNIALQELDVRSSYNPERPATGTGTDQIIVVSGRGDRCSYVGGHSKIGELIARAITSATICAVKKNLEAAD